MDKYVPLRNKVLIKKDKNEEKSQGGIFYPEAYTDNKISKPCTGTIVASGVGITDMSGKFTPNETKKGERVFFNKNDGTEAAELGEDYLIVPESSIYAVIGPDIIISNT